MNNALSQEHVFILQQGGADAAIGENLYILGVFCLTIAATTMFLLTSDAELQLITVFLVVFTMVLNQVQLLQMFILGFTIAIAPAIGVLVIYLLMEVPIGE